MRKTIFTTGNIYHVYNRGVEKRTVFENKQDYFRFIHDLFEFNDEGFAIPSNVRLQMPSFGAKLPNIAPRRSRTLIVHLLAFCLMPNHFHLLLQEKIPTGISQFMHKLGTGYTNYFNLKYEHSGSLFQGTFKAVHIEKDAHFFHILRYIHANPLSIVKSLQEAPDFLNSYRWSSYLDYVGIKNFPSVTQREPLLKLLGNPSPEQIHKNLWEWITTFSHRYHEMPPGQDLTDVFLDFDE